MGCFICEQSLAEDAEKYWLVEEAEDAGESETLVDPDPVCLSCARKMVGKRGPMGQIVFGFKVGESKPGPGGLILKK